MRKRFVEGGGAAVHGKHLAAHERPFEACRTTVTDVEPLAHRTTRTVHTHQIACPHGAGIRFVHGGDVCLNIGSPVGELPELPAMPDLDARPTAGVAQQGGFDELLRHAVGQLCCTPRAVETLDGCCSLPRRGQAKPGQLVVRKAGEVRDVGRVVSRQPLSPDLVGKTMSPEMFHGACLRRIGLRVECGSGLGLHQHGAHAASPEFIGQHETAGPAANDQHIGMNVFLRNDRRAHR
ncbi:hypothetical protein FQZ97_865340 [compost metagenome]